MAHTLADVDKNSTLSPTYRAYEQGFLAGQASRDEEFEGLQRVADYWYRRALDPTAPSPEAQIVDSIIVGMEVNEERRKKYEALNAIEKEAFDEARELLAEGMSVIEVAKTTGLFAMVVQNIQDGVL